MVTHPARLYCPGSYRQAVPAPALGAVGGQLPTCVQCGRNDLRTYETDERREGWPVPVMVRRLMAHYPVHVRRLTP